MPAAAAQLVRQSMSPLSQLSAINQLEQSNTHTRDTDRSSCDWERLPDGTWFRREYFRLNQPVAEQKFATGMHVLKNIFTGSYDVVRNTQWLRSKDIHRVLVLGCVDIPANDNYRLRVVNVVEGQLDLYFDSIVSLITEAVNENANVLLLDIDGRTFNPACLVAFLICSGWAFDWAVERIEGIFHIAFNEYKLACLTNWKQIMDGRRAELVADVQRNQSAAMPQILQSPLPKEPAVITTSYPAYSASAYLPTVPVLNDHIGAHQSRSTTPVPETKAILPPRVPKPSDPLLITSSLDVTPTTTDQWGPRRTDSKLAIQNILRKLDAASHIMGCQETMTA